MALSGNSGSEDLRTPEESLENPNLQDVPRSAFTGPLTQEQGLGSSHSSEGGQGNRPGPRDNQGEATAEMSGPCGNVFWSQRANDELRLLNMRPTHLPPADQVGSEAASGVGPRERWELDRDAHLEPQYFSIGTPPSRSGETGNADGQRRAIPRESGLEREAQDAGTQLGETTDGPITWPRLMTPHLGVQGGDSGTGFLAREPGDQRRFLDLPAQELMRAMDDRQRADPMMLALVQRLEEAEAKTRSTSSMFSIYDFAAVGETSRSRTSGVGVGVGQFVGQPSNQPTGLNAEQLVEARRNMGIESSRGSGFRENGLRGEGLGGHRGLDSVLPGDSTAPSLLPPHSALPSALPATPLVHPLPSSRNISLQPPSFSEHWPADPRPLDREQGIYARGQSRAFWDGSSGFEGLRDPLPRENVRTAGDFWGLFSGGSGPEGVEQENRGFQTLREQGQDLWGFGRNEGSVGQLLGQPLSGVPPLPKSSVQAQAPAPNLLDLDPIPIVKPVPRNEPPLIDILSPKGGYRTPFLPTSPIPMPDAVQMLSSTPQEQTPRTPRVGTSLYNCTPGGTRVPDGPPPETPPRGVTFGPVVTTPLPPSPIPSPPMPPFHGSSPEGSGHYGYPAVGPPGYELRSEEPSKLVHALPTLSIPEGSSEASVITGDWIARIGPIMRSMSPNASTLWQQVMSAASAYYQRWLHADPLQRLTIRSEVIGLSHDYGVMSRVEERSAVLLLQSLPQELQSEAVSVRALSSVAVLFMVMCRFQPGGGSEKEMILSFLTQPTTEGPPGIIANHSALRKWERLLRRCTELGVQVPDATLLVRALDSLGKIVSNKSHNAGFRLSTFRHQSQLDISPSEGVVLQFCQLLIAELETLMLGQGDVKQPRVAALPNAATAKPGDTTSPVTKKGGKGEKGGGKQNSSKGKGKPEDRKDPNAPCRFFDQPDGCRFGPSCNHYHPRLDPSSGRCFSCGSTKHGQAECPRKTQPEPSKRAQAQARKAQAGQGSPQESSSEGSVVVPKAPSNPRSGPVNQNDKTTQFNPRVSALVTSDGTSYRTGLLDGGATHALRAATPSEWEDARDISVNLATGSVSLRINACGTLLTQDSDQQPILPLGVAIEQLGLRVSWIGEVCNITHPRRGRLKVFLQGGCPEVSRGLCLELIRELEQCRSTAYAPLLHVDRLGPQTSLREVLRKSAGQSYESLTEALRTWYRSVNPDVPEHLVEAIFPCEVSDQDVPGLNRRSRKRLRRGGVLLHYCSGKQSWSHQDYKAT